MGSWSKKNFRFSNKILLYLQNNTRQGYSYNKMPLGMEVIHDLKIQTLVITLGNLQTPLQLLAMASISKKYSTQCATDEINYHK